MKISSTAAMWFFIILMIAFMVASHLNGEKIQLSAFTQGVIFSGMIGMFFGGASVMAQKNRETQLNSKLHEEVIYNEKNSKV